jgi:mRNA interferase RelE/StbE
MAAVLGTHRFARCVGLLKVIHYIKSAPPEKADSCPFLTGNFAGLKKYRIGNYRIIYSLIGDTALILRIRHRREAYR